MNEHGPSESGERECKVIDGEPSAEEQGTPVPIQGCGRREQRTEEKNLDTVGVVRDDSLPSEGLVCAHGVGGLWPGFWNPAGGDSAPLLGGHGRGRAMSLIRAILAGRLGRDPKPRYPSAGKPVCSS